MLQPLSTQRDRACAEATITTGHFEPPLDPVSLLFAVDGPPPATLDIEMPGWVPTLELTPTSEPK